MPRPAKFNREDAVEKAMQAIWSNGFEQSSVKNLSELLGITRSSFYNAFGSREDLFREAALPYAAQSPGSVLNAEWDMPPLARIVANIRDICRTVAADPEGRGCMITNAVNELCPDPTPDGLGHDVAGMMLNSVARLEELLHEAHADGSFPFDRDAHVTALAVQNLMVGLNVFSKVVRSEGDLWSLAKATLNGLGIETA